MPELNVQTYLRQHGLQALVDNYAVKTRDYPEQGLLILNYDQIESPKNDPITNECRGLILDRNSFDVVSRSFDRFFNYGECGTDQSIDFSKCHVVEKLDGSLIKLFWHNGSWHVSTRGTSFAESGVNGFDLTFADLAYRAIGVTNSDEFNYWCENKAKLNSQDTYICEITAMENRVVTKYVGTNLYLLAVRNNSTGEYVSPSAHVKHWFSQPRQYCFDSVEHCLEAVKELPNLEEGYVLYNTDGKPVCKIKSPAYVAAHLLRGEGLNPKRIAQLVLMNEVDEYLSVYPEDEEHFESVQEKYHFLMMNVQDVWDDTRSISDRKEFALRVKDHPLSAVLFQAKNSGLMEPHLVDLFHKQTEAYQLRALGVK